MSMSDFHQTAPFDWHTGMVAVDTSLSVLYRPFEICWQVATLASSSAAVGAPLPPVVVAWIELLWAELPNWLIAATLKVNVVPAARPVTVKLVFGVWPACVPLRNTRYWTVQSVPGVEAFQARLMLSLVCAVDLNPVGTLGSVMQTPVGVVAVTAALKALLPAALTARTR